MSLQKINIWWFKRYLVFAELSRTYKETFESLSYEVVIETEPDPTCLNLVLGAVGDPVKVGSYNLPYDKLVIINYEQMHDQSSFAKKSYFDLLKKYRCWDYSEINRTWFRERLGISVEIVRTGYALSLELVPQRAKDIDVLFYGALNARRKEIYHKIKAVTSSVIFKEGLWEAERDEYIARSKIVLNLHYHPTNIFEWARVSYLLNNKVFVISEKSADDLDYSALDGGLVRTDEITSKVLYYLTRDDEREQIANQGYKKIRSMERVIPKL